MSFFAKRDVQTSLLCPLCQGHLHIARTCHEVFIRCPKCEKTFPLKCFIAQADETMEQFLEGLYVSRI